MQIQQLRYLVAAAEHGSFRAAAQHLFVSQSSLSVAIGDLERECGTTAFSRTTRGITLTSEGVELVSYARQVLEQVDLMERRYARDRVRETRLCVSSQHYYFVVEAFGDFVDAHGGEGACDFSLRETYTNQVIKDVQDSRSDLGVIYLSNYNDRVIRRVLEAGDLRFMSLFVAQPHVFVSAHNPLAERDSIAPEELTGLFRYVQEQGIQSSSYFAEEPLATIPNARRITVGDNGTLARLLARGEGYTIATGVFPENEGLVSVPLETDEVMNVGYIAHADREPNPLQDEFLGFLMRRIMDYSSTVEPSSLVFDRLRQADPPMSDGR